MSMTSSTDVVPTTGKGSSAVDITTSPCHDLLHGRSAHSWRRLQRRWGRRRVLVQGHHHHVSTTRASPGWWLRNRLGTAVPTVARPSSTAAAVAGRGDAPDPSTSITGGGGAPDSSTAVATGSPSSTSVGSGSAHEGWGRGSEGTTLVLWDKRFRGARLSTPVSVYL
jgi:hypothetical protein